jgi:hypothetical protein
MSSLRSGFSALVKRDKLKQRRFADLLVSYVEERWFWPTRVRAIHQSAMAFPIYLRPRCFGAPWFSDSDAVYLASEAKLVRFLASRGCRIEFTANMVPASQDLRNAIIYIVARTPESA